MATNHASGRDVVPVQVGRVRDRDTSPKTTSKRDGDDKPRTVKNTRSGNARVGHQADTIVGDIVIGPQTRR